MRLEEELVPRIRYIFKSIITECLEEFLQGKKEIFKNRFNSTDPLELLTVAETCVLLKVSKPTVYRHIKNGKLSVVRIGDHGRSPMRLRRMDLEIHQWVC